MYQKPLYMMNTHIYSRWVIKLKLRRKKHKGKKFDSEFVYFFSYFFHLILSFSHTQLHFAQNRKLAGRKKQILYNIINNRLGQKKKLLETPINEKMKKEKLNRQTNPSETNSEIVMEI